MENAAYSLLRAELIGRLMPLFAGLAVCAALVAVSVCYIVRFIPRQRRAFGQEGTTELEFALALPFFLVSVMTTVQIALMVNANLIVDYAAFCAARSAAVWLPQDLPGEGAHTIAASPEARSEKWGRIERAATLAVIPISPRITSFRFGIVFPPQGQALDGRELARLARAAEVRPNEAINWGRLGLDTVNKFAYAALFTDVDLVDGGGNPQRRFAESSTVTARVTHKFEMAVPFAGPLLGAVFGDRYIPLIGGYFVPISAAYTLLVSHQ